MTDYAAGGRALEESTYLMRPEKWLARKRYDLIVAQDLTRGAEHEVHALAARAAFEGAFGLAILAMTPLGVIFAAIVVLMAPKTDNYAPVQIGTMTVAVGLFVACYLRGRAAQRHIQHGD